MSAWASVGVVPGEKETKFESGSSKMASGGDLPMAAPGYMAPTAAQLVLSGSGMELLSKMAFQEIRLHLKSFNKISFCFSSS